MRPKGCARGISSSAALHHMSPEQKAARRTGKMESGGHGWANGQGAFLLDSLRREGLAFALLEVTVKSGPCARSPLALPALLGQRQNLRLTGPGQGRALLVNGYHPQFSQFVADKQGPASDHCRRTCRIVHDGLELKRGRLGRWRLGGGWNVGRCVRRSGGDRRSG